MKPSNEIRSLYLMNRATNWGRLQRCLVNFYFRKSKYRFTRMLMAISEFIAQRGVPMRDGWNGVEIAPGDTDKYDWNGLVPFEELPHSYNPESGYVSSANNRFSR